MFDVSVHNIQSTISSLYIIDFTDILNFHI